MHQVSSQPQAARENTDRGVHGSTRPALRGEIPRRLREFATVVANPVHLRRTLTVAAVVGTWLTTFNHGDELLRGAFGMRLAAKIALDYLTPFIVSNVGLLARQRH